MAAEFYRETEGIWRLRVPFEGIYTSVFLVEEGERRILVDCATTARDVEEVILPALAELGLAPTDINTLVLTHRHGDHAGGAETLLRHAPALLLVDKAHQTLCDGILTYPMGGHTEDSIGVLDTRTGTLIAGDGIQGAGVDKYPCYTQNAALYLETLARIRADARIENILFSHAYAPWCKDTAHGRAELEQCLADCLQYVKGEV
jgi:glyoxylase-like metal-dependent hydrolase (beta-lactamase superfamily II)